MDHRRAHNQTVADDVNSDELISVPVGFPSCEPSLSMCDGASQVKSSYQPAGADIENSQLR